MDQGRIASPALTHMKKNKIFQNLTRLGSIPVQSTDIGQCEKLEDTLNKGAFELKWETT
jgi:hypothetical protein